MSRWPSVSVLLLAFAAAGCRPSYDLIVRGGEVVDGTGAPARAADVGIRGDRIAAIGDLSGERGVREIDATGRIVAPGFIDTQGQSGTSLLVDGAGESHVRQGITTEIIGEGGTPALWDAETADTESLQQANLSVSWSSFDGYQKFLEERGTSINVGSLVPATMLRRAVIGLDNRDPTADEMQRMEAMADRAMQEGGFGLSSALIYPPGSFAKTDELVRLARVVGRHGGRYVTHVRGESFRVKEAIGEAIAIGEQAGLPVVVFHLKVAARRHWGSMPEVIALIEGARGRGLDVTATQYPYTAGGTGLSATLPGWAQEGGRQRMLERLADPALRARMRKEIETTIDGWENLIAAAGFDGIQIASVPDGKDQSVVGKRLAQLAAERRQDPWDAFFSLLIDNEGRVGALYHMMSEDDVRTAMRVGWVSVGTDAAAIRPDGPLGRGQPHPRAYGTFPRILGRYVREHGTLTLPDAVRKMTGFAAEQMRIPERGLLREGYFADVVVFDPATVTDTATFERPHQFPIGIETVVVNGMVTVDKGAHTGARAGRALFGPGYRRQGTS